MDGPILVHPLVDVLEEVEGEPVAETALGADSRAKGGPGFVQRGGGRVTEAVAVVAGGKRGVEEEEAVGEGARSERRSPAFPECLIQARVGARGPLQGLGTGLLRPKAARFRTLLPGPIGPNSAVVSPCEFPVWESAKRPVP